MYEDGSRKLQSDGIYCGTAIPTPSTPMYLHRCHDRPVLLSKWGSFEIGHKTRWPHSFQVLPAIPRTHYYCTCPNLPFQPAIGSVCCISHVLPNGHVFRKVCTSFAHSLLCSERRIGLTNLGYISTLVWMDALRCDVGIAVDTVPYSRQLSEFNKSLW